MPFNPFSVLTSKVFGGMLLAALMVVGLQSCQLDRARDKIARLDAQVTAWKLANEKATAWAKAEKRAKETAATTAKDNANDSRKVAQAAGARAGDDYAARNRCLRVTPAGDSFHPDLPRPDSAPGQPERPAPDDSLVAVDRADFNTCTASIIDLNNARAWADDMLAKGLAR